MRPARPIDRLRCFLALAVLCAFAPVRADSLHEAIATVTRLHEALIETAAAEPPLDFDERYARLAPVIMATHDLPRMARYTIGRAWRAWSEAQRAGFTDAFERLSIATYASRFAGIGRENFEILGAEPEREGTVRVHALIHRNESAPVELDYLLETRSAGESGVAAPRIVMVYNDGVSELSIKRSEYAAILESGSYADLLDELDSQRANMR